MEILKLKKYQEIFIKKGILFLNKKNIPVLKSGGGVTKKSGKYLLLQELNNKEFEEFNQYYSTFPDFKTFMYCFSHLIPEPPRCPYCKDLLFYKPGNLGFANTCGKKECRMKQTEVTNIEKYGCKAPTQNKEILAKRNQNNFKKYGVEHCTQLQNIKEKTKRTNLKKYGVEYIMQNPEFQEKSRQTNIKRYGVNYIMQKEEFRQKRVQTYLINYGAENPSQVKEIKIKKENTCFNHFGVRYASQNPEIQKKSMSKYTYNNISFDSQPELAYYIWLSDNGIPFEYHPNISFKYTPDPRDEELSEVRYYCPDFKLDNLLIEIKGDQFFNKNNEPYHHLSKKYWFGKLKCMEENNVKILRSKDYKPYIEYVKNKYGKDFLKTFRNKKSPTRITT